MVTSEHGRALTFVLNLATATFTSGGGQTGSRLRVEQALEPGSRPRFEQVLDDCRSAR